MVPAGREVGEYLVNHPGVDKVSFTGSTAAGRKIGAACGANLKRFSLELEGSRRQSSSMTWISMSRSPS